MSIYNKSFESIADSTSPSSEKVSLDLEKIADLNFSDAVEWTTRERNKSKFF